jgi:hypothetical protein
MTPADWSCVPQEMQAPPFFDRLSPFSTVFRAALIRDSVDESRVGPFSGPLGAVKKR